MTTYTLTLVVSNTKRRIVVEYHNLDEIQALVAAGIAEHAFFAITVMDESTGEIVYYRELHGKFAEKVHYDWAETLCDINEVLVERER